MEKAMPNIHELILHLNNGRQADEDGVFVTVSRHAVMEAIRLLNLLGETNEALAACQSEAGHCFQDAARYRWLRENVGFVTDKNYSVTGAAMDVAIDRELSRMNRK
jgi:hypothetical protein